VIDVPLLADDLRAQGHQSVDALLSATREDSCAGRAVAALTLFTIYARVPKPLVTHAPHTNNLHDALALHQPKPVDGSNE
jgi:hypothetical protein